MRVMYIYMDYRILMMKNVHKKNLIHEKINSYHRKTIPCWCNDVSLLVDNRAEEEVVGLIMFSFCRKITLFQAKCLADDESSQEA